MEWLKLSLHRRVQARSLSRVRAPGQAYIQRLLLSAGVATIVGVAACGGQPPGVPTAASGTSSKAASAARPPGTAQTAADEVDLDATGLAESPGGKLRVSGRGGLLLAL